MTDLPQIFDGPNVLELDADTLASLEPSKRDHYFAVVEKSLKSRDIQQDIADTRSNLYAIVAEGNDLQAQFDKVAKVDRIDELRRAIAAQNAARVGLPPPPRPEAPPEALRLAKEIEDNNNAQSAARAALYRLEEAAKVAQAELSEAIMQWQGFTKPDPIKVAREHMARLRDYEIAVRNGEIEVEEAPPPRSPSHLDDVLSSGSKGHNINYGFHRPQRGHQVNLPSER
jgi:hypothetical protein